MAATSRLGSCWVQPWTWTNRGLWVEERPVPRPGRVGTAHRWSAARRYVGTRQDQNAVALSPFSTTPWQRHATHHMWTLFHVECPAGILGKPTAWAEWTNPLWVHFTYLPQHKVWALCLRNEKTHPESNSYAFLTPHSQAVDCPFPFTGNTRPLSATLAWPQIISYLCHMKWVVCQQLGSYVTCGAYLERLKDPSLYRDWSDYVFFPPSSLFFLHSFTKYCMNWYIFFRVLPCSVKRGIIKSCLLFFSDYREISHGPGERKKNTRVGLMSPEVRATCLSMGWYTSHDVWGCSCKISSDAVITKAALMPQLLCPVLVSSACCLLFKNSHLSNQ